MTREQAKKNLIALGIAEPTEDQVSNYLNQFHGDVEPPTPNPCLLYTSINNAANRPGDG